MSLGVVDHMTCTENRLHQVEMPDKLRSADHVFAQACTQSLQLQEGEGEAGQDSHDEYQGAWKVAINQGVVLRLNLHARQPSLP